MLFDQNDEIFEEIITRQLRSLRIDAQFRKEALKDLKKLEKELVAKLQNSDINGTSFQINRLNALLRSVKQSIKNTYASLDKNLEKNVTEYVRLESEKTAKILNTVVGASTTALPPAKIKAIYSNVLIEGSPSSEWWSRQEVKLQQMFSDNIKEGLLRGETNQQLVQRIRGTRAFNFTNGVMNTSRRDAETLIRSSVQAVANKARFDTFEANSDLVSSFRQVSTLDGQTTDICIVRDGLRWKNNAAKTPIGHNIPFRLTPLHWNCRSTHIAELKGVSLPDDAERASVDGPVKASVTFNDFLKNKDKAFQDDLLGVGKAKLWRSNKITLRQLLDQSGNPLTLTQLEAKYT